MSEQRYDYDYATIRLVPCVPREAFATVGVVLHARTAGFLGAICIDDAAALATMCPEVDPQLALRYLRAISRVADGGADAGPIGVLPASERFHWLTSPRSAAVQTSRVHTGRTDNPAATLKKLFDQHVTGIATSP